MTPDMLNRPLDPLESFRLLLTLHVLAPKQAPPLVALLVLLQEHGVDRPPHHPEPVFQDILMVLDVHLRLVQILVEPQLPLDVVEHPAALPRPFVAPAERTLEQLAVNIHALAGDTRAVL